jgi:MtN3 and saliva related transmembrane protein
MKLKSMGSGENFINVIGIVAGILTSISLLPQLIKIIKNKKSEDVSVPMLIILFCGVGLWIYYGFLREDLPIIATNISSLLLNTSIIILSIKYKEGKILN